MEDSAWDARVRLVSDPGSYPDRSARIELVQTHISLVGLSDSWVLKVKKPIDLGFLDFSTADQRREACEAEVRLNRRLCEHAYEGVVPILPDPTAPSGLRVGGIHDVDREDAVDYAVLMHRLEDGGFMNQLLRAGHFVDADLDRVVARLARFYRSHPATEESEVWGSVERVRISIDENFDQIEEHVGTLVSAEAFKVLKEEANRFLEHESDLFERRMATGMIRECHGDLRLDHVHLTNARVCIYDCIEFNERFRYLDVASDVAFLAMDLDHKGRPDLAARFGIKVAAELGDPELLRMLPFYKTYRAVVRAKVAAMKSQESEVPETERAAAAEEARSYFRLATRYVATADHPMVIVVMGRIGTGKSTQASLLARACGWRVFASDVVRKRLAGVPAYERGDDQSRKHLYSTEASEATYAELLRSAATEIEAGHSVVLDATFSRRSDRDLIRATLGSTLSPKGTRVPHRFIEIVASDALIRERLLKREHASHVVSDARLSDFEAISSRYEPPHADEESEYFAVSSSAHPEETHLEILIWLARTCRESSHTGGGSPSDI